MQRTSGKIRKWVIAVAALLILAAAVFVVTAFFLPGFLLPKKREVAAGQMDKESGLSAGAAFSYRSDKLPGTAFMYRKMDFTLEDASGNPVSLSSFSGKVVIMTFFSTWSEECREEIAKSGQWMREAQQAGAVYMLVGRLEAGRETREQVISYLTQARIPATVLFDTDCRLYNALSLRWIPNTLFFSPRGELMSCLPGPGITKNTLLAHIGYAASGATAATEDFLFSNLISWQGAMAGSYQVLSGRPRISGAIFAASQAMLLSYAVEKGDKTLFDKTYQAVDSLLLRDGLAMALREDGKNADYNQTRADLEIIKALLLAQEKWGGYEAAIQEQQLALRRYGVGSSHTLRSAYDFGDHAYTGELPLSHGDLQALQMLAAWNKEWLPVYEKTLSLLEKGKISDTFPLYHMNYDYQTGTYASGLIHMDEEIRILTHLAFAKKLPENAAAFVKKLLREGKMQAAYTVEGAPAEGYGYESPSVYGLCARLGLVLEDREMVQLALDRMESLRVFSAGSPLNGSYSHTQSTNTGTEDILISLLVWKELENKGLPGGEAHLLPTG